VQNSLYVQVLRSPILTALLHSTQAARVSQTLRRGTRNGITELSQLELNLVTVVVILLCMSNALYIYGLLMLAVICWTDRDAVWVVGSHWPKKSCVRWGSDPPWERTILGERAANVKSGTLWGHLCENSWTDRDAVWTACSDWPKKSRIRWGPDPHKKGQFWGKGSPIVKYRDFLPWAVQKRLNRSINSHSINNQTQ